MIWFASVFSATAFAGALAYPGNKLAFLAFSLVFIVIALISIRRRNVSYAHFFLGLMLVVGIWLKLTYMFLSGVPVREPIGNFTASPDSFDHILLVACIGGCGYLLGRLATSPLEANVSPALAPGSYPRWRTIAWGVAILFAIGITVANLVFGLHVRGRVPTIQLRWPFGGLFAFGIDYGVALVFAILLGWDREKNFGVLRGFAALCIQGTSASIVTASRALYIFHTLPVLITEGRSLFMRQRKRASLILCIWVCGAVAIPLFTTFDRYFGAARVAHTPTELNARSRGETLSEAKVSTALLRSSANATLIDLAIYRWPGLEGLMATSSYEGKSLELLKYAALQRRGYGDVDLYTKTISGSGFTDEQARVTHYSTQAGPIAFLYFSGSLWIVFFGMAVLALGISLIERVWRDLVRDPAPLAIAGWYLAFVVVQLSGGLQQAAAGIVAVSFLFLATFAVTRLT